MKKKLAPKAPKKGVSRRLGSEPIKGAERLVTMSNALTRAGHGLTLSEKRMVAIAASRLDPRQPFKTGLEICTRIDSSDYAETFGVDLTTAYEQLAAGAKALFNRSITFYEPAHTRKNKPIGPTKVQMRWVGQVKYHAGEGWVELHWWHKVLPHLIGIQKQFTTYQLKQSSALRSTSSWKLLELLMRFQSTGFAEYSIEDFCVSMDATERQSRDFGKIRTKLIEPAVKELSEKDGWMIEWRPIKRGRKVSAVRFEFSRDPQRRLID